ncbi:MAG: class I SAM-dependent DNA methyltransferase [Halofilum sp. (in: g-proteobacteria)]|nr:class I SAM-dependent DNA methyltransferase [Halofilum sp. (in: g-proteobacteria)]
MSYGDYLEQLTYLIFLKLADEYSRPPYEREVGVPEGYDWPSLKRLKGAELEAHYIETLRVLGQQGGMLGQIFMKAQNKIQDPAKLARVIEMIDAESWAMLGADVKGDLYEGLLEKNAEDIKSGAGQYFTPRPLIDVMVECIRPEPGRTIADPACGTGGFFLKAYDFITENYRDSLDRDQKHFLKHGTFHGNEIVADARRLCLMNLFLHNIGDINDQPDILPTDALIAAAPQRHDYVLTNPPFGRKSSMTFVNESTGEQEKEDFVYERPDFWTTTSNKQLNFVQHIRTMLKENGQAAVVVPDNVLFEGGAGETVRRKLLETTDLHTILRLPTGIFYAQGVKANVLFFDNRPGRAEPWTNGGLVLRLPHATSTTPLKRKPLRREQPAGVHRLLQAGRSPPAGGDLERGQPRRPVAPLHPRRNPRARQGQPRHILAA